MVTITGVIKLASEMADGGDIDDEEQDGADGGY